MPRESKPATVVFVHGVWMHGVVFMPLRRRLARAGFATAAFSYHSLRHDVMENARRLHDFLQTLDTPVIHLVGHSLGGIVILRLFADFPVQQPGRIVLLGAPVRGSQVARTLAETDWGSLLLGRSGPDALANHKVLEWNGSRELGVIAGTATWGIGRLFADLAEPHDGTVAVEETRLEGAADSMTLPVTHTSMLFAPAVANSVCRFLRTGRFGKD